MGYFVAPGEGETVLMGGLGVVHKLSGRKTGDSFFVVEHPVAVGALAAPPHTHTNEGEFSLVLEGEIGARSATKSLRPDRSPTS